MVVCVVVGCFWGLVLAGVSVGAPGERVGGEVGERLAEAGHEGGAVVVHYLRADGEYSGWNVWAWAEGGEGSAYGFGDGAAEWAGSRGVPFGGETEYGPYAVVPVDAGVERVGFVVRRGNWESKDVDRDRFVEFEGGVEAGEVREVWLVSGDERVFSGPGEVDLSLRVIGAFLDDADTIVLTVSGRLDVEMMTGVELLTDGEVGVYGVERLLRRDAGRARGLVYEVELDREVEFDHVSDLELVIPGVDPAVVYARGVLLEDRFTALDAELGPRWGETSTVFRVWSPVSDSVAVLLYGFGEAGLVAGEPDRVVPMTHAGRGVWEAEVAGDLHGAVYRIGYESYGERRIAADIHCRAASQDSSRSVVVDMSRVAPEGWGSVDVPRLGSVTDEVIYEVHVRDFTVADPTIGSERRGTYLGLIHGGAFDVGGERVVTGVDHLLELGVTGVHLLPIQDFSAPVGQYNWGYWTALFNVAESNYATDPFDPMAAPRELRAAIQGLHERGVRVILDVVYNHTSSSFEWSPFFQSVPYYWFRTEVDGTLRNDAGVGNSMADERPMVRKYIGDSLVYWLEEYRVDGYRFDLLGTHRPESVREWVGRMREVRPDVTLYGEPWTGGGPLYFGKGSQRGMGMAVFNDHLRNAVRGDLDGTGTGFATGPGGDAQAVRRGVAGAIDDFADAPVETINYVSAHDNLTFWDKLLLARPDASDAERRAMQKLAHGIVLTSQGVAFIHAGAEFARTKGGNHNSYNAGDEVNKLDWARKAAYRDVNDYVAGLVELRLSQPVFRMSERSEVRRRLDFVGTAGGEGGEVIAFTLDGRGLEGDGWERVFVAYNGGAGGASVRLPGGEWNVVVDAERAGVETLGSARGRYELPAYSMVVMWRDGG